MEDKTTLSAILKVLPQEQKEEVLAAYASKEHLIPEEVRGPENIDLLPTAFSLAVVGKTNLNDDVIDRDTAFAIAPRFVHRQINVEHDRSMIVGHIVGYGFSNHETGEVLTKEEIIASDIQVFNLDLSAVVYRVAADPLAQFLEEASNEESENYQAISTSWELMFSNTHILLGADSLNDPNAKILSDPQSIALFEKYLRGKGGKGVDEKGRPVKRLISIHAGDVIAAGAGYVGRPAADVQGVEVYSNDSVVIEDNVIAEKLETAAAVGDNIEDEKQKQKSVNPLKQSTVAFYQPLKDMIKLSEIKDIAQNWDQLKEADTEEAKAAVSELEKHIQDKLVEGSEKFAAEKKAKEEVQANLEKTRSELENLQSELKEIKESQAAQEAEAAFNSRMAGLDEEYDLDEATRKVVAKKIQGLDEEGFAAWKEEFDVLAAEKKRDTKKEKEDKSKSEEDDEDEDEDKSKSKKDKKDKEKEDKSKSEKDDKEKEEKEKAKASEEDKKEEDAFASVKESYSALFNTSSPDRFSGSRFAKVFEQKDKMVTTK